MSDFDMMLQRKKSVSGKRRRNRDGGTFISDADDVVSAMIIKMNEAAEVYFLCPSCYFSSLRKSFSAPGYGKLFNLQEWYGANRAR